VLALGLAGEGVECRHRRMFSVDSMVDQLVEVFARVAAKP
jgi:hypothetical protein